MLEVMKMNRRNWLVKITGLKAQSLELEGLNIEHLPQFISTFLTLKHKFNI